MTTQQTTAVESTLAQPKKLPQRKLDPIMEELYAVRAKLNEESGYNVKRLVEIVKLEAQKYTKRPAN